MSVSKLLGPSSRNNEPLSMCRSLSSSRSQLSSMSSQSRIPSLSSSTSSQLLIPSPSQSLLPVYDFRIKIQFSSELTGLGLARLGQFQACTSSLVDIMNGSSSFSIPSLSKSNGKSFGSMDGPPNGLSGTGVPPMSGSNQSQTKS